MLILATAIALLLSLCAGSAPADGIVQTEDGFRYIINMDGTAAIVGYEYSVFTANAKVVDTYFLHEYWNLYDMVLPS